MVARDHVAAVRAHEAAIHLQTAPVGIAGVVPGRLVPVDADPGREALEAQAQRPAAPGRGSARARAPGGVSWTRSDGGASRDAAAAARATPRGARARRCGRGREDPVAQYACLAIRAAMMLRARAGRPMVRCNIKCVLVTPMTAARMTARDRRNGDGEHQRDKLRASERIAPPSRRVRLEGGSWQHETHGGRRGPRSCRSMSYRWRRSSSRSVRTVRVAAPSGWVPVSSSGRQGRPFGSG